MTASSNKCQISASLICGFCVFAMVASMTGCDPPCIFDGVCDDGDPCTIDACFGDRIAECSHTPIDCGDQVCDPESGECVECIGDSMCAEGEVCESNVCVGE